MELSRLPQKEPLYYLTGPESVVLVVCFPDNPKLTWDALSDTIEADGKHRQPLCCPCGGGGPHEGMCHPLSPCDEPPTDLCVVQTGATV